VPPRKKKPSPDDRPPVQLSDPRDIRALAHPARMAVIDELYTGRELTATECAEIAGLSPSAMSYHLRSLEKAGIVERAESTGDGRERPWRAAGSYLQVESGTGPSGIAASAALSQTVLGRTAADFDDWIKRRSHEPQEWIEASTASYGRVWLLPDEAKEVEEQMIKTLERFRHRRAGERPPGARRVRIALMVFPSDGPKPDAGNP
jgi:DNA-binding transcriptional ArsR family regulator